jgi:hypothetical protein
MAEFTLKLSRPVEWEGREISQVTLRSPSVVDFRKLLKVSEIEDPLDEAEETIAIMGGLDRAVVSELPFEDFVLLSEAAAPLLEAALAAASSVLQTRH